MIVRTLVGGLAVLAVLLAGCSAAPTPEPLKLPSGVTREQVVPPEGLAKDIRGVPPCSTMTTDQVSGLGLLPTSAEASDLGGGTPYCQWHAPGYLFSVSLSIPRGGLVKLYQGHDSTPYKLFEPMTVDGYPAVRADQVTGSTDCTIYVGLAEDQAIWVTAHAATRALDDMSCPTTKRAISAVLSNLPPLR